MRIQEISGLLLLITLTVIPAVYEGQRCFRWGEDREIDSLAGSLSEFPQEFEGWVLTKEIAMDPSSENLLTPVEYFNRTYSNGDREFQVFVLLGPTGPTAVHTPDVCFSSTAFASLSDRERHPVSSTGSSDGSSDGSIGEAGPAPRSEYWKIGFRTRRSITGAPFLCSWYAWTADGILHADTAPRYSFSEKRYLMKVQITTDYPRAELLTDDPVADQFTAAVADEIQRVFERTE